MSDEESEAIEQAHYDRKQDPQGIGLATVRTWTDEAGSRHSEPKYQRLVCFGKLADFTADRVKKSISLYAEGLDQGDVRRGMAEPTQRRSGRSRGTSHA